jgi:sodium/hydrogen exchanger-like protein 6/7
MAEPPEAGEKEFFASWALFILIMLLIIALFTSYMLQQKRVQAVHETVISIFAGGASFFPPISVACNLGISGGIYKRKNY